MLQTEESAIAWPSEPDSARRAALARIAALCGLAMSGEALAALAKPKAAAKKYVPELLSADELALTGVLAELVIPQTETPGALAVRAHHTIDHLLAVCTGAEGQRSYRAGLARIEAVAQSEAGKRFGALPAVRQNALLKAIDTGSAPFTGADQHFFRSFKQHVLFAYYTSEAGATRELAYLPVPGGFKGRIKLTKNTRTWAL